MQTRAPCTSRWKGNLAFLFFFIGSVCIHVQAQETETTPKQLFNNEKIGIRLYKDGDHARAYEKLRIPAEEGLKNAQYYLGFMYLKGQYVDQSVQKGMGWLGVATEVDLPEWQDTFDKIYQALSTKQRKTIDALVARYIADYGMSTQKVSCSRGSRVGSRKILVLCKKAEKVGAVNDQYRLFQ